MPPRNNPPAYSGKSMPKDHRLIRFKRKTAVGESEVRDNLGSGFLIFAPCNNTLTDPRDETADQFSRTMRTST